MATNGHLDTLALERTVLHDIETTVSDAFAEKLITRALRDRGIVEPDHNKAAYKLLKNKVASGQVSLSRGRAVSSIVRALEDIRGTGLILSRIEKYADKNEIQARRFTRRVKQAMVKFLLDLGVQLDDDDRFEDGAYDEYLAMAYANAIRSDGGALDPVIAARLNTASEPWDFSVTYIDDADADGIVSEFIRRAGVLYYVHTAGDVLGTFRLADYVTQLWDDGVIDIVDEATETLIVNYMENTKYRGSPERRALEYKRVLNLGDAKVPDGIPINEPFPKYWARLMREGHRYRDLTQSQHEGARISRQSVLRAIRDLQNNLTEFAGGGTGKTAQKMYAQLDDAFKIVGAPEVVEQLALGRRKGIFRVIESLFHKVYGKTIDAEAMYDLAKTGDQIFTFLANFTDATPDEEFEAAVTLMEDWVLLEGDLLGAKDGESAAAADEETAVDDTLDEAEDDEEMAAEEEGAEW